MYRPLSCRAYYIATLCQSLPDTRTRPGTHELKQSLLKQCTVNSLLRSLLRHSMSLCNYENLRFINRTRSLSARNLTESERAGVMCRMKLVTAGRESVPIRRNSGWGAVASRRGRVPDAVFDAMSIRERNAVGERYARQTTESLTNKNR